jgi:hypothetical protein
MVEANSHNVKKQNEEQDLKYYKANSHIHANIKEKCNESYEQNSDAWNLKLLGEELSSMPRCSSSSGSEFSIDSAELDSINNLFTFSWEKSKNSPRSQ